MKGRIAIVTGGTRGIGKAISIDLKKAGCKVAANYAGNDDAAKEFTKETGITAFKWDVSDFEACQKAVKKIEKELDGVVEILVNNAGITASNKFVNTDDETWERIMRVNATGPFYCCREVIPAMIERRWGRIINIASVAGLNGLPYSAAYSASKHALLGLTRSIALEHASYGITANAICPGWTETDMSREAMNSEGREGIIASIPLGRIGKPEDPAAAACFLLSDLAQFITGSTITVDGGFDMRG